MLKIALFSVALMSSCALSGRISYIKGHHSGWHTGYEDGLVSGRLAGLKDGYAESIAKHGDWLLIRDSKNNCAAYDPRTQATVGHWASDNDGQCHMAEFIRQKLSGE